MKEYYEILIASLLHDIGKFKERAFGGEDHSAFPKSMEGIILPHKEDGRYTHRHALWTYDFFENDITRWNLPGEIDWKKVKDLASMHHNADKDKPDEAIIQRADIISAASDRSGEASYERGAHLKRPLKPVFSAIELDHKLSAEYGYGLARISPDGIFPFKVQGDKTSLQSQYKKLWDDFLQSGKSAFEEYRPSRGMDQFVMLLVSLLQKYCWCIPSATNDLFCDISLYDHAVSTAAIALVLKALQLSGKEPEKPFLFFAGDLSGIQNFIFQHHQKAFKGSSKIIRGRSMFITAISHLYTCFLCKKIGIPPFVQLLNAGGKFTLILPNTDEIKQTLEASTRKIDEWFFNSFHGDFTVVYDYSVEGSESDLSLTSFKNIIATINYNLAQRKRQKFHSLLKEGKCVIDIDYGEDELCKACGRYAPLPDTEEDRCKKCEEMFQLGSKITKKSIIAFHEGKGDLAFGEGGMALSIVDSSDTIAKPIFLFSLDEDIETLPYFFSNTYVPLDQLNTTMDFEQIAACAIHDVSNMGDENEKAKTRGSKFLAYIKVDVDNMGAVFSQGLKNMSISRYVTLSRMLNTFFTLYVKHLLEKKYSNFYTVFSGGDDLFLIAPWDEVLHFIHDLQQNFTRFVCAHGDLHFSSGIIIQKPNYPMSKAAVLAEDKLEEAKDAGRNRISYFITTGYDEMQKIHEYAHWFVRQFEDKNSNINHAFFYRLLQYVRMAKSVRSGKCAISDLFYIPSFKYDIVRNIRKSDAFGNIVNVEELKKLEELFFTYTTEHPEVLETIVKIALYTTREYTIHKEGGND